MLTGQPVYTGSEAKLGSHDEVDNAAASDQMRVLVLAPAGRDAEVTANVLSDEGLFSGICASIVSFASVAKGAGAAIVAEEALGRPPSICWRDI